MKFLILLFLLPLCSIGQTIHYDGKKIIYQDSITLRGVPDADVAVRLQPVALAAAEKSKTRLDSLTSGNGLTAKGAIRLNSIFRYIVDVHFSLRLIPAPGGYTYVVDNFYVTEKRRGGHTEVVTAKELINRIEETGTVAIENERLLNEIDLRLQKFLTLLASAMNKGTTAQP